MLTLWSHLLSLSSRSLYALLTLFPVLVTLVNGKLRHAKAALLSLNASVLISPGEYPTLPPPPFLFFTLSLSSPFSHAYFHLQPAQVNHLLYDNLVRRGDDDAELAALLASPALTPSALFSHTGFLYSALTRMPASVDTGERDKHLFAHFVACLQDELTVIAGCGAMMPTLQSLISNAAELQLVAPSALSAGTRPGLCAFRLTPSSIPASFHDQLTQSLGSALSTLRPTVYRVGELAASASSPCIVVEICGPALHRGPKLLVEEVQRQSKRLRLPEGVERELSAALKRSISEAESKLKGGGGVIRSIPIVGSMFSYFAGKGAKTSHSYDIGSSYQQPSAATASAGKNKPTQAKVAASSAPLKAATPVVAPAQSPSVGTQPAPTTPLTGAEEDGVFSRGSSSADGDASRRYEEDALNRSPQLHEAQHGHSDPHGEAAVSSEDQLFAQLASRNPSELLSYITEGTVVTVFFPMHAADASDAAATSAIPVYLFYDPSSSCLCWCEPGHRYITSEQTLPIAAISELHLGNAAPQFPADAEESRCFSIVSDVITLHCEDEDAARRDELLLALYWLLSQVQRSPDPPQDDDRHSPQPPLAQSPPQQHKPAQAKQPLHGHQAADVVPLSTPSPAAAPTPPTFPPPAGLPLSSALELLESGSDFTVFLVDRANPALTSRHPVVLWWIPDSTQGKGRLCWCSRPGGVRGDRVKLEYHPSRSLLLNKEVEVSLGKQTKALCNAGMEDVSAGRCVSILVDKTVLNLAAESEGERDDWLSALHTIMTGAGTRSVTPL